MLEESNAPLEFIAAAEADQRPCDGAFVIVARTRDEVVRWLTPKARGPEWLQVEGLLDDPEVWTLAAEGGSDLPLDVVLSDPAKDFPNLYRLASVAGARDVRVTIPAAAPGFMKALRLAASLGLPVRLLPGQPSAAALAELTEAVTFYLHDPAAEAPIECFHSLLAAARDGTSATLWEILEQDPAIYATQGSELGRDGAPMPRDFVATHLRELIGSGAECTDCRWQGVCGGYFKWPTRSYDCAGVKQLLARIDAAAEEMARDLAELEPAGGLPL